MDIYRIGIEEALYEWGKARGNDGICRLWVGRIIKIGGGKENETQPTSEKDRRFT
jgi:hypothetical protein